LKACLRESKAAIKRIGKRGLRRRFAF